MKTQLREAFTWLDRVLTIKTGQTKAIFFKSYGLKHTGETQIAQAVQANEVFHLFHRVSAGNQFPLVEKSIP